jgi:hypothetical protein
MGQPLVGSLLVAWYHSIWAPANACERRPLLLNWLEDWCDLGKTFKVLEPEGWFTQAHKPGCFGWSPAPAAAGASIDQLCEAVHKRPFCFHVFAVPLLMTNFWPKQLLKAADVNFVLNPGSEIWSFSQHEPLGIFISLPLSRHEPWRIRKTKPVVDLVSVLREVQNTDHIQKWDILRKFLRLTSKLDTIPEIVVRAVLQTPRMR